MQREAAETVALEALAWLAADAGMLRVFCGATGIAAADLRRAGEDPELLAGVLDFVCLDDAWVAAFASAAGLPADAPAQARAALPGGETPHWT